MDPISTQNGARRRKSASLRFIDQFLSGPRDHKLVGVLLGQLDAFNRIAATFGIDQSSGFFDEYAQQLRMALPPSTPVIRLSNRRFAIVLGVESMTTLIDVASKLAEEQAPKYRSGPDTFMVDLTIGIAVYPTHGHEADSLFRRAELALNEARSRELNFEVYRPDATQQQHALWKFASELEQAARKGAMEVYMQPKVHVSSGAIAGAEALVRWRQDSGRLVSPNDFIPLAERSGSIVPITWFVFDRIEQLVADWPDLAGSFTISVNVSAQALDHIEFTERLRKLQRALERHNISLIVELTEESLVENFEATLTRLERIRRMGIGLAIDDFGSGYSSLTYLKEMPATEIKIDKKFVGSIAVDEKDWHIVKATMDLAHAFGMQVVAEGVDNPECLQVLDELGCEMAQGFYIARPMRGDLLGEWVRGQSEGTTGRLLIPVSDSTVSVQA